MTLDDLADFTAEQLNALSPTQLKELLEPYFKVTRPEFAEKKSAKTSVSRNSNPLAGMSDQKRQLLMAMQEEGIDLGFLKKKVK